MPCILALVVLAVLSIFSAKYRKLAKEAFGCVSRRVTLRPCDTGFDIKVRTAIVAKILPKFPKVARVVNQRFELIAWVFVIIFTVSFMWTARGIYNYWAWGNCNGQYSSGGFCAFDPTGANNKVSGDTTDCKDVGVASHNLSLKDLDLNLFPTTLLNGANNQSTRVVMFGCFACDYTRKTYPVMKKLLEYKPVQFTFIHFPTKHQTDYLLPYDYCIYQQNPDFYWKYIDIMFNSTKEQVADESYIRDQLTILGLDLSKIDSCRADKATQAEVNKQMSQALSTGIYGTPTIYINGTPLVGPKPERVYQRLLN